MFRQYPRIGAGAALLIAALLLQGCCCAMRCPLGRAHGADGSGSARAAAEVRQASERFTQALEAMFGGDMEPMELVWSHAGDVSVMTPFGGRSVSWGAVRGQLTRESQAGLGGHIVWRDLLVRTDAGGQWAYTVGNLVGEDITRNGQPRRPVNLRTTSVWRREKGAWRLVHHHADLAPALAGAR